MRLGEGDYEPAPEVSVLYRLYELVRVGVCEETRMFPSTKMLALAPLAQPVASRMEAQAG